MRDGAGDVYSIPKIAECLKCYGLLALLQARARETLTL